MHKEIPTLEEILVMENPDFEEIFFGDLRDDPIIRAKISDNPKYTSSKEYLFDIKQRLIFKYNNDLDLAYADIEQRQVAARIMFAQIEATKRRMGIFETKTKFPAIAKILIYFSAPEESIGCLEEIYLNIARNRGNREANVWLWCQVTKSAFHFAFAAILHAIKISHLLDWIFKTL